MAVLVLGGGGGKFNLAKMGCMIHHLDRNFEENSDLKWEFCQFPVLDQKPKKEIQCGKFNIAKMGHSIHHSDHNVEENSDLKSVFELLLCSILYGFINACNYPEVIGAFHFEMYNTMMSI